MPRNCSGLGYGRVAGVEVEKCSFKIHRNKYCFLKKLIKSRKTSFLLELHRGQQILLVESKTQKVKVGYFLTLVSQTTMMSNKLSHSEKEEIFSDD